MDDIALMYYYEATSSITTEGTLHYDISVAYPSEAAVP